jgi:EAL domain-containing protein (putative c-di-GMP-specific phosphodiesterase class I)
VGPWLDTVMQIFRQAWARFEAAALMLPMPGAAMARSRELIGAQKVCMLYQPIIDLRDGACTKVEALARLCDGERLRTPDEFLPACGSVELGQLFSQGLSQVLRQLGDWEREGLRVDASINLPPSVLRQRDLCAVVERELLAHGIEPSRLTFELLETEQWIGDSSIDRTVESLKVLGTRMAMDDMGAGHSTLLRLRQLQFDLVKIDRELVRDMPSHPQAVAAIVGGLTDLMHRLGLAVVVEGLETPELVRLATELGADAGQGFAIARPLAPRQALEWLLARRAAESRRTLEPAL